VSAALFFMNTEGVSVTQSLLTTLDGHGVFFSGYTRGAVIDRNEFVSIGETAISQWGYTDGSPVPGMGWDARAGNQVSHPHRILIVLASSSPHPHTVLTSSSPHPHNPHRIGIVLSSSSPHLVTYSRVGPA